MTNLKTVYKERTADREDGDLLHAVVSDPRSRGHSVFCAAQDDSCPHGAWGKYLSKRKNHPLSGTGKQVVLSVWVPGGIACKVTVYAPALIAVFLLSVSSWGHMVYLLKTANKRSRVFIAHDAADLRNGDPGIKEQGHSMVHFNISYKGNETNTGLFTDQSGTMGD